MIFQKSSGDRQEDRTTPGFVVRYVTKTDFTYFFLLAANGIAKRVNKLPENPTTALITHQIPANTL